MTQSIVGTVSYCGGNYSGRTGHGGLHNKDSGPIGLPGLHKNTTRTAGGVLSYTCVMIVVGIHVQYVPFIMWGFVVQCDKVV